MKKTILTVIFIGMALGTVYLLFAQGNTAIAENSETSGKQQYTCGMHPEIISDEPGYCPICEMKLTPKKDGAAKSGSVYIDPVTTQNMGLKTTPADYHTLSRAVRAFGKVTYREANLFTVNLKVNGWVEKLYVDFKGERVAKGQPLLEIYSPELVAAQKEYLIAYKASLNSIETAGNMQSLLEAARERLFNWDISKDQLERLEESGEISRTMLIRSPADGVVVVKKVSEGKHLKAGVELYLLADLTSVWVVADVYEHDLPWVSLGQEATVILPHLPGENFTAAVSYVSPYLDENSQAEVRLELKNPRFLLKPEMYAEVTLHSVLSGNRLAVPRQAVIHSGVRELVYVASGEGAYEPRLITAGAVAEDDLVEVKSGLAAGENVVVSGQFLLDSESRLSEAIGGGFHQHGQQTDAKEKKNTGTMAEHDHGTTEAAQEGHEQSGIYTCPMSEHFHVLQHGEGRCPECNMKLVPVEETDNKSVYICPMPEDSVVSAEPGNCPRCNMRLVPLFEEDKTVRMSGEKGLEHHASEKAADTALSGIYTCPMPVHYHILQYGEGECAECGMKLVPVEKTDNTGFYVCPMTECGVVQAEPGRCSVCGMKLVEFKKDSGHDK